jgi:GST-like protein
MITHYAAVSPNPMKVFIALEELNLPYAVVPVDLLKGAQFDPDFLKLSPYAKAPVIIDDDGPGGRRHTVFESGAILLYLADKTGQLIPQDPAGRSETIQWVMLQMSSVGPLFGQYSHFARYAPTSEYAMSRFRTQVHRLIDVYERRLGEDAWLGGSEYGVADIATFPWLQSVKMIVGQDAEKLYPSILEWVGRIASRPAIARAGVAIGRLGGQLTPVDKASPDELDRLLERGAHARA